jgi:hypothetical protein
MTGNASTGAITINTTGTYRVYMGAEIDADSGTNISAGLAFRIGTTLQLDQRLLYADPVFSVVNANQHVSAAYLVALTAEDSVNCARFVSTGDVIDFEFITFSIERVL